MMFKTTLNIVCKWSSTLVNFAFFSPFFLLLGTYVASFLLGSIFMKIPKIMKLFHRKYTWTVEQVFYWDDLILMPFEVLVSLKYLIQSAVSLVKQQTRT